MNNEPYQFQPLQQSIISEPGFRQQSPNKNLWIYLLIGLVVAGGAFGFYIWQKGGLFPVLPLPTVSSTPTVDSTSSPQATPDPTADWQTYRNDEYGFEVKYPEGWELNEPTNATGLVVSFLDPETKKGIEKGRIYPSYDLSISFWPTINNEFARGGSWSGQREYVDLSDYFTDESAFKKKIREITIDRNRAFEVSIGGAGLNYGIMLERNGIYELSFGTAWDKSQLSASQNQILSTFRFIPSASSGQVESEICIQVITPARNLQTGEIRDFPTPCDVPEGWIPINGN